MINSDTNLNFPIEYEVIYTERSEINPNNHNHIESITLSTILDNTKGNLVKIKTIWSKIINVDDSMIKLTKEYEII